MNELVAAALTPATPGAFVRILGSVLPGVGRTRDQIVTYAEEWKAEAHAAIESDLPVFVALGDSLAQGVGASTRSLSYVNLVRQGLEERGIPEFAVLNLSRSGARIHDVLETQLPALEAANVDVFGGVCTVGSNDLVRSSRLRQTRRRFTELLVALPDPITMVTIPDSKSMTAKSMNKHIRRQAELLDRPLIDVAAALTSWRGMVAGDGFHPNDRGYQLWADTILAGLELDDFGVAPATDTPALGHRNTTGVRGIVEPA